MLKRFIYLFNVTPLTALALPLAILLVLALMAEQSAAQPGDLDASFGSGGKVTTTFNFGGARATALQRDGKIVVAGQDDSYNTDPIALARYNADGSLDTSFGNGGRVTTIVRRYDSAHGIAIQADGRIVVAGEACIYGPICDFVVVRYAPNGSLDTSFDGDGIKIIDMGGAYDTANDLAIQPDGKIVIVGASGTSYTARNYAFAVVRLNSDGSFDTSFDGDGKVITSLGSFSDFGAAAVALQPDGKIIAAGQSGSGNSASADFALVRYNSDGSLDASFDGDGKVFTDLGNSYDGAADVAVQADGKIVATGGYNSRLAVVRYNTNGSLDASFDGDGIVTGYGGYCVAIQSNGKIVVAGGGGGGHGRDFLLERLNPNGSLDTSFGGGIVTTSFDDGSNPSSYGGANGIAIQPDGKIIAAGFWGEDGEYEFFAIARYIGDSVPVVQVSGRVTTPDGRGLRNAAVSITDSLGVRRTTTTSSFGFYTFDEVRSGDTYMIGVNSRLYRFASRTLVVNDNLTNVDFVGLE